MEDLEQISSYIGELHICTPSIPVPIFSLFFVCAPCADFYPPYQTWPHQECNNPCIYHQEFQKQYWPQASFLLSVASFHQPFSSDEEFEQWNSLKRYATFLRGTLQMS